MRFFAVALIFFGVAASSAQTPEVPHKMRFADMTLIIRDDARREIQKDVDMLTRSPRYFGIKVERARTYFPLIEKVFAEERLPDDFKYLALQESALIADAVSESNAVGFWQFKDYTALEMGLRVDKEIDERMNIVSASRGAAKYLKQSNFMFNNWLYALQSYQMGAGGVRRVIGDEYIGAKHMEITSDTYWYVKRFLAHKVAFEDAVKGEPQIKIDVVELRDKKSLKDLVKELGIEESDLLTNNKWIRSGTIPGDKMYPLVLPKGKFNAEFNTLLVSAQQSVNSLAVTKTDNPAIKIVNKEINGVMTIQALANENHAALASRARVPLSDFLKYNDLSISEPIRSGEFYFTAKKKNKSKSLAHTLTPGEDLWLVSQHYGVTLRKIEKLNRIDENDRLKPGDVVWVGAKKPAVQQPIQEEASMVAVVEQHGESDYFDWEVNPGSKATYASKNGPVTRLAPENRPVTDSTSEIVESINQPGIHIVSSGETLYSISKLYNVEVPQLVAWNQLDISQKLKPGQEINTTDFSAPPVAVDAKNTNNKSEWFMYEVKTSDTLYSVARQYNVTIKEIMDWNGKSDFTLSQGEKLKILSK